MQLPDKALLEERLKSSLFPAKNSVEAFKRYGRVVEVRPTLIKASLPGASQGDLCIIGQDLKAEVVALAGEMAWLSPFDRTEGISCGLRVTPLYHGHKIAVGEALLGGVVDGFGLPLAGEASPMGECRSIYGKAPDPLRRTLIREPMPMGIRAIDGILTCGIGQRIGVFAAAGGGKSTLLGMMATHCQADVVVLALVGERGREVREFLEQTLSPETRARSVTVVATSDRPALERVKASYTATTIAEYFRDQGKNVLLMVDSLTRYARAAREIGLAAGEPPATGSFPPSVFAALPGLLERAGPAELGSITAIYTVLVEGDDINEPVADEVRSILDGHIVLSRKLAGAGHYPAIDINASVSRVMNQIVTPEQLALANKLRHLLALYEDIQLLLRVGEYQRGLDPQADEAVDRHNAIIRFLRQKSADRQDMAGTWRMLEQVLNGAS